MIEIDSCFVGITFTYKGFKLLNDLTVEEKQLLFWRIGLNDKYCKKEITKFIFTIIANTSPASKQNKKSAIIHSACINPIKKEKMSSQC